jgi:transposase-like protein
MVRPTREKLKGFVEVDEAYLAITDREDPAPKGKSNTNMVLVIVAVEILSPRGFGRIRLRRIQNDKASSVIPFVEDNIERGSRVRTDGLMSYLRLRNLGYRHVRKVHIGSSTPPHVSMPGVHRVCSLLKRWMIGTHHGSVQPKHLDAYLDEFVFRFNRRTSRSRGLLFYRLIEQAVAADPVTYNNVVDADG